MDSLSYKTLWYVLYVYVSIPDGRIEKCVVGNTRQKFKPQIAFSFS